MPRPLRRRHLYPIVTTPLRSDDDPTESRLPVEIVPAGSLDDIRAIASLYPAKTLTQREEMVQKHLLPDLRQQENGRRMILLAMLDGRVVGTVQVVWESGDDPILWAPQSAIIHHLRTHEEFQGRGIGTQLLKVAEHQALDRGLTRLALGVEPDNLRARRFYEASGFQEYGQYRGEGDEPILALQRLQRDT